MLVNAFVIQSKLLLATELILLAEVWFLLFEYN